MPTDPWTRVLFRNLEMKRTPTDDFLLVFSLCDFTIISFFVYNKLMKAFPHYNLSTVLFRICIAIGVMSRYKKVKMIKNPISVSKNT